MINGLMLFKEIIAVYSENRTKAIKYKTQVVIVKADDTYSHSWALKSFKKILELYFISLFHRRNRQLYKVFEK
jgi:hypothetical protein